VRRAEHVFEGFLPDAFVCVCVCLILCDLETSKWSKFRTEFHCCNPAKICNILIGMYGNILK